MMPGGMTECVQCLVTVMVNVRTETLRSEEAHLNDVG